MLIITNQITKTELLKEMSKSLANSENSLHLEVESLPNFLNTAVAFTIFNYQISNFPKPVFWLSYDNSIVRFLHNCHAQFPPNFLEAQQPLLTTKNPEFANEYLNLIASNLESLELENVETEENIDKIEIEEKLNLPHKNYKLVENFDELNNQKNQKVSDFSSKNNNNFINFKNSTNHSPNTFLNSSQNDKSFNLQNDFNKEFQELTQNNLRQNLQKDQNFNQSNVNNLNRKKIDFNFPISEQIKNISDFESLSAKNLFRNNYNQSSLIGSETRETKRPKKVKFNWNFQNIFAKNNSDRNTSISVQNSQVKANYKESTNYQKQNPGINIENLKNEFSQPVKTKKQRPREPFFEQNLPKKKTLKNKIHFQKDIFNFQSKNQLGNLWNKILTKKNTLIAAITSFSFAVVIFFFFLSFFPTQAYTLQISPIGGTNKTEFELNLQQFESQNLVINTTEKIATTGKQKIELPKSTGKFQLINRGNSPVYLTNGGFLTFIENKRYFHKFNPNLPGTITIPGLNENSKMEIELEAENKGDNYNLVNGVSLNIANLKGDGVCDNCFAKTVEEIKNSKTSPQNIVSEEDKKKLLEIDQDSINKKIASEIEKMIQNNSNILVHKDWYKIIDKNSQLNSEIGKPTSELVSSNSLNITFWSLKKDQIIKLIKEKDDKIFVVNDLTLENSIGSAEQKSFKVTVNYNYLQYENLSRDEIIQELEQKPVEEVQKLLQIKYSGLQNIQKEEKGIKVPGINPRINVNIVKNSSQNSSNSK